MEFSLNSYVQVSYDKDEEICKTNLSHAAKHIEMNMFEKALGMCV